MRSFDNLPRAFVDRASPGGRIGAKLVPSAALRRAVAKFHGLLRIGSNRKEL
jgi:hypothetical protein